MTRTQIKRRALAAGLALLLAIGGVAAVFALRPDWGYRAWGWMRRVGAELPLTPYTPAAMTEFVPDEADLLDTLMLVNADHPLPEGFLPALVQGYNDSGFAMHPTMAAALSALTDATLAETGELLFVRDGYRSRYDQAERYAEDPVLAAIPGASEHETGLALDLCTPGYGGMAFLKTAAGRYVGDHAADFGLIIRYPAGGEGETGIPYEPWHVRYVGLPHAAILAEGAATLEGYLAALSEGDWWQYGDYLLARQTLGESYTIPSGAVEVTVAPDNTGHAVLVCRLPDET